MDGDEKNWRRLAAATVLKAVQDAQDGDPLARQWLAEDGAALAEALDLPAEKVTTWVGDLPPVPQPLLF